MNRWRFLAIAGVVAVVASVLAMRGDDRRVIDLPAGRHAGFTVAEPTVVRGEPGAVVTGTIDIRSDDVRLEHVVVETEGTGIAVRDVGGVVLDGVVVRGAMEGIDANDASVTITDCTISGTPAAGGQAIEIRNANGRARSVVRGCQIDGGQEGIVSHVSRVEFLDNTVTGTAMRGIAVTEMSEGLVEGNTVHDVMGTALYCGDMSHCEVRDNSVRDVRADPAGIRQRDGQAVVAWYYSTIRLGENDIAVARPEAVDVYSGSVEVSRFPLSHWPAGWRGAVPGLGVVAIAVGVALAARLAVVPVGRALRRRYAGTAGDPARVRLGRDLLLTMGIVQILHVGEHVVQVFQVYVAESETRQGLAGQWFDTEWLHLGFNGIVLGGLAAGFWLVRRELATHWSGAMTWLLAAAAVQSWHVAEHVARVIQYLGNGVSPAPGLIGDDLGLVWFHFGINIAVIAPIFVAAGLVAARHARRDSVRPVRSFTPTPSPA